MGPRFLLVKGFVHECRQYNTVFLYTLELTVKLNNYGSLYKILRSRETKDGTVRVYFFYTFHSVFSRLRVIQFKKNNKYQMVTINNKKILRMVRLMQLVIGKS